MRQRTAAEQTSDAAPDAAQRARVLGLAVVIAAAAGLGLWAMAYVTAHPTMPPECAVLYGGARTRDDTLRIDELVFPKQATLSCGAVRASVRRSD